MEKNPYQIATQLQQCISAEQAFHYRIVPVSKDENGLRLKTDSESLQDLLAELNIVLDSNIHLESCDTEELQHYLTTNYRQSKSNSSARLDYTVDFLEKILLEAKSIGSSDIHFEPYEGQCRVRFRLDGRLLEYYSIPIQDYPTMVNKVKIRAHLDIAEKRLPQDGRITIKSNIQEFDIRVSSLPTLHGEKLVLRILSKDAGTANLDELGMSAPGTW